MKCEKFSNEKFYHLARLWILILSLICLELHADGFIILLFIHMAYV